MRNHDIVHEIPFVRRLRSGMHLDDALLIALDAERAHCRLFSVARDDPAIADPYVGLVNIFDPSNDGLFVAQASRVPNPCKIFTLLPEQRPKDGNPVIVPNIDTFRTHWNLYTENMLTDMDWRGVVAAGGSVLACLSLPHAVCGSNSEIRHFQREHFPTSDVDLFLYGMSVEEAETKITAVYETIKESVPFETVCIRTKNTISIHSNVSFSVFSI